MQKSHVQNNEDISQKDEAVEEVMDFTKPDFTFIPKETHEWRQQGYYLVCYSCEVKHAVWIGKDSVMVGLDAKGQPIIKTRKVLGMA